MTKAEFVKEVLDVVGEMVATKERYSFTDAGMKRIKLLCAIADDNPKFRKYMDLLAEVAADIDEIKYHTYGGHILDGKKYTNEEFEDIMQRKLEEHDIPLSEKERKLFEVLDALGIEY